MRVNFYATLREITGRRAVEVALPEGASVDFLLEVLLQRYPALRRELFDPDGQLYQHVHVIVNGRDVPYLKEGMKTVLTPEDTVSIFPAVGGG
jgi:sulfur-carrier protein